MSRLAHQVAYLNGSPAKQHSGAPAKEDAPDLHVLDMERPGTAPDISIEVCNAEEELALLRSENAALRGRLEQNEQLMHAAVASEEVWLERQKEYEMLLEEKSDVIRSLHQKIHDLKEGSAGQNLMRADELTAFKKELDERQAQLAEDEKSLTTQMRTMEMSLSRDRAELARQRNDLQRLQAEINREIEMSSRDSGLRDRLASLCRRSSTDAPIRKTAPKTEMCIELPPLPTAPLAKPAKPAKPAAASPSAAPPQKKVGFLRRLFGG